MDENNGLKSQEILFDLRNEDYFLIEKTRLFSTASLGLSQGSATVDTK
jgi:hypothetical protein